MTATESNNRPGANSEGKTRASELVVSKRSVSATMVSFGGAQAVIAASSIVRIPLLASVLGQGRLGLNFVVGNLAPFLLAIAGGVRIASRNLVAQQHGAAAGRAIVTTVGRMQRVALRAALGLAALGVVLTYALPLHRVLGAGALVSAGELNLAIAFTVVMCAGSCFGAVGWGKLEAEGRIPLLNGFIAGVAVGGLGITLILTRITSSFFAYAIVNSGTSALPWYLPMLYIAFRPARPRRSERSAQRAASRAVALGTAQAAAPLATRALDPVVISAGVSPQAAGTYGVAQRLSLFATFVPQGVSPLVAAHQAQRRGAQRHVTLAELGATAAIYGAIAGVCGLVLVAVGPAVSLFLGGGHFSADRSLFVMFAILGVTASAQGAFTAGAAGPRSMFAGLWIDGTCALANVALSFALVGALGMKGPVVASIIASSAAVTIWVTVLAVRPVLLRDVHDLPQVSG